MMHVNPLRYIFLVYSIIFILAIPISSKTSEKVENEPKQLRTAIVTLLMEVSSGFATGAITLAQSLIDTQSQLQRVIMVTPDVDKSTRQFLKNFYHDVVEVQRINCIFKTAPIAHQMFDMEGPTWRSATNNWRPTCTKLAVWNLTSYDRVIFMDSDMLAVGLVDEALSESPHLPFLAAPEILPPDTINSGFMVLEPSADTFAHLLALNADTGVAWTGDQYLINHGLCPNWHKGTTGPSVSPGHARNWSWNGGVEFVCGRLPWIYNTQINNYHSYSVVQAITAQPQPRVIHFISDGKPWSVLATEFSNRIYAKKLEETQIQFGHALWRRSYYKVYSQFMTPDDMMTYAKQTSDLLLNDASVPGFLFIQGVLKPMTQGVAGAGAGSGSGKLYDRSEPAALEEEQEGEEEGGQLQPAKNKKNKKKKRSKKSKRVRNRVMGGRDGL